MKRHPTPNNNLAPTQTNIPLTPEDLDDPEKLILVAQKYFATAFPNERRVGCPAPGVIQAARVDQPPGDELRAHLFRCSECFIKYSAVIWDHHRRAASGATAAKMKNLKQRVATCDWPRLAAQLDERGYALTAPLLSPVECDELISLYADGKAFRSRVVMERHNFGGGEYQYFAAPLPPLVAELRESLYPPLAEIANRWMERMNQPERFPPTLTEFLSICHQHRQTRPTPLLLRYKAGDYNCLHQDLYGEVAFPLQAACVLNQLGRDYTGGEFLLNEQRPHAQTRGEAIAIDQGQFIIFPNRYRPVRGARGDYRVNMRHGISRLRSGERYCLGVIFHDAL